MAGKTMFMKSKWYPRPHSMQHSYGHGMESGVSNVATIYPVMMYDEGLGAPSGYNANPEHASFAEAAEPNCYPESRVNSCYTELQVSLTKAALETDKVTAVNFMFMPIFMAFENNYTALDEKSTLDVSEILELTKEATDRQGYPLWNGVDMKTGSYTSGNLLPTNVPGLTTDQKIEGVAFSPDTFYDAIQYYTNGKKVQSSCGGLKRITLSRQRPTARIKIRLRTKNKTTKSIHILRCDDLCSCRWCKQSVYGLCRYY